MKHPPTAQFYLPNPDGSIALYYRITQVKFNDGTVGEGLQYLSSFGVWQGSFDNDRAGLMKKLIPLNQND